MIFLASYKFYLTSASMSEFMSNTTGSVMVKYVCALLSKQNEVTEFLSRLNIDIMAVQESWQRERKNIVVGQGWVLG